jgi:hypothetical protein
MPSRCRPRPLRLDQVTLLAAVDPACLRVATAMGVVLPGGPMAARAAAG